MIFPFPPSIDDERISLQNATVQVWQKEKRLKDNMELWTVEFFSHYMDICQIDSFMCILLYNKYKEKVIIGG